MCGITGVYCYARAESALDKELLAVMAGSMAHRGPDYAGIYLSADRRAGLGFRRLAIIDLSPAGHQPMSNEDGSIWIVFNGEIYNHAELRPGLEAKGHFYKGRSDTETIIHLYEEYGDDCVQLLRGMFAMAIWDEKRRRLFLARDRLGIKPLYYTVINGTFVFGSEIKALTAYPEVKREVDNEALYHYLTFMVPPAPLTMFRGIRKLPAGCAMVVDANGMRSKRYWDAIITGQDNRYPDKYYADKTLELLRDSARIHMMSDVPVGVFLSGGMDSSALVALIAERSTRPVATFSVGFKGYESYNELDYAQQIANSYATDHHEVIIDHKQALDYLPELVHSQDEPIADWVCVPLYFVSKLAREHGVTVVQVGEGADELFCGYPLYLASLKIQRLWPLLGKIPSAIWQIGGALAARFHHAGLQPARKAERLMRILEQENGRFWGGAVVFRSHPKALLLDAPVWRDNGCPDSTLLVDDLTRELTSHKPDADALERMTYLELKYRLAELLLMRVDKVTMSTSIEARVPYLDHRLVEFAMSIPQAVKVRNNQTKAVLKRAVAGLIPSNIVSRPKQGFSAPVPEWLRNELAAEVRSTLLDGEMVKRGYFNQTYVKHLLDAHQFGRSNFGVELWNLYNVEMWHRHWVN
jgi:asparagine synthase (glutamine-hydrolysing)